MNIDRVNVLLVTGRETTMRVVRAQFRVGETEGAPIPDRVVHFPDVPAALTGLEAGAFQVALLDNGPGECFQQPLKVLREAVDHLPVVVLADSFDEDSMLLAFSLGAQECVPLRGLGRHDLRCAVRRALARHHGLRAKNQTDNLLNAEQTQLAAEVYHSSREGIIITDASGEIVSVNRAFSEITGYSAEDAIGRTPNLLKSGRHDDAFYARMWASLNDTGQWRGEIWNRRKNGDIYPEWLTISAVKNDRGEVINYLAIFIDISQRIRNEELLRYLATHDPLTNLPNRELFRNRLHRAIARAQRNTQKVAILMLDLDGFKNINDRHGHAAGDLVLKQWAERLKRSVRESDTVARLGGDEFSIILEGVSSEEDAITVVEKILRSNQEPYALHGFLTRLTASIGITLYPDDGESQETLLDNADQAMYAAKARGKEGFSFYSRDMERPVLQVAARET